MINKDNHFLNFLMSWKTWVFFVVVAFMIKVSFDFDDEGRYNKTVKYYQGILNEKIQLFNNYVDEKKQHCSSLIKDTSIEKLQKGDFEGFKEFENVIFFSPELQVISSLKDINKTNLKSVAQTFKTMNYSIGYAYFEESIKKALFDISYPIF
jgi:hypothetical protein